MDYLTDVSAANILFGVVSLLYLIYHYATSTFGYWKERGVPFAKPLPLFGNYKDQILGKCNVIDIHRKIYNQFKDERFVGFFMMRNPVLMIRDPELIERVLVKDFAHFCNRAMVADPEFEPLTLNLFNAKGQYWRNLRHKLTPTFSSGKLKAMFDQISKCGENFTHELLQYAQSGEIVEAKTVFSFFTTDVIATCAFGLQLKINSPEGVTFREMLNKVFAPTPAQALRFSFRQMYPSLTKLLGITTFPKGVNEYFLNIIKSTIHMREKENINRNDFVQLLMNLKQQEQMGTPTNASSEITEDDSLSDKLDSTPNDFENLNKTKLFTDSCIAAQTFVFLTAGSDSTSATLSFVLYLLAKHQDIQQRVQAEIDEVLARQTGWSYQAIKDMSYLDQVLQEGMRMFPIATFLSRNCNTPYQLPGTNLVVEKNIRITIPVPSIHMDPNNYPNPEVFDPERFKDNNHRPSAIYLPFGDGPRMCIAIRFALLEMKVCLAHVLAQYTVHLNEKTQEPIRITPRSFSAQALGGIWVKFEKRASNI